MNGSITLHGGTRAFLPIPDATARVAVRTTPIGSVELCWATLAATLVPASLVWDFSWESSIGADRFWSPPHLATHIGVWLSGLLGLWLVFKFTLARHWGQPAVGINLGPCCAPAGAWVLLWSAAGLQAAFLLDAWWQRTYALSAGMWPPPQILKAAGFFGLLSGALLLSSQAPTRQRGAARSWLGGLLLSLCALILTMTNYPNLQHTATFYLVSCAVYPAFLLVIGTERGPWAATRVGLAYMAMGCAAVWLLPLFPARPLTPPIYNPVSHMMPPAFPLLLVVPACLMDLARRLVPAQQQLRQAQAGARLNQVWHQLTRAAACALGFAAAFLPTQWFFARFLLSPQADNWVFAGGGRHWPYFLRIDQARTMFWGTRDAPFDGMTPVWCLLAALVSAWLGLRLGVWLNRLRR